jgi:hypothetical protein
MRLPSREKQIRGKYNFFHLSVIAHQTKTLPNWQLSISLTHFIHSISFLFHHVVTYLKGASWTNIHLGILILAYHGLDKSFSSRILIDNGQFLCCVIDLL